MAEPPPLRHNAAVAIVQMIADPSEANREAMIDALVEADDMEFAAAFAAFCQTYPKGVALAGPLGQMRAARKKRQADEAEK